mmetsp:Transcript_3399/g.2001  ORF Transcript_3399/g.2001 Transcript_3399/m.2001 type:complete len:242 (+) Transcript_3399:292-1017(+)
MEEKITALSLDDSFRFSCSQNVPCFNECCKNLNQFLTPYDVLRLKNYLSLSSSQFLERYTTQEIGAETGLPIIIFKPDYKNNLKCPFVSENGCKVYESRPSSCRTYPIVRLASRNRKTGKITEHFALLKEEHCLGFKQEKTQTVREWLYSEDVLLYNEMNDMLLEIISMKRSLMPRSLDIKSKHLFHMACYDIDSFRTHILEKKIVDDINLDTDLLDKIRYDDTELLKFGIKWLKTVLFKA